MNKLALVGTAMCSCAIALVACTQPGASDSVVVAMPSAAVFETMDRDDQENGRFTLVKFCEQGWKMLDGSIDPCAAAYAAANERGERDQRLLERAIGDNPRHWDVRGAWEVAAATAE